MRITVKTAKELLEVLEEIRKEISKQELEKYPFSEWERGREKVKERIRKLRLCSKSSRYG